MIIKKDGSKLYCKIIAEDSTQIFFLFPSEIQKQNIDKNLVEQYIFDWNQTKVNAALTSSVVTSNTNHSTIKPEYLKHEILVFRLNAGVSAPIKDFGSSSPTNDKAGYALTGLALKASAIIKPVREFGFVVSYLYSTNRFNTKQFDLDLTNSIPNINFSSSSTPWIARGPLGGMYLEIPLKVNRKDFSNQITLNFEGGAGYFKIISPEIITVASNYRQNVRVTSYASNCNSISYYFGSSMMFKLSPNFCLNFSGNYFYSEASFKNAQISSTNGSPSQFYDFKQTVNFITIAFGFSILIN
jgi:hypothetical protein